MASQTYEDNAKVTYSYDDDGNLSIVADSATGRTGRYYYDVTGRLIKQKELGTGCNLNVNYSYDSSNRLSSVEETLNGDVRKATYTYDGDNRVSTYKKGTVSQNYTYDGFGRNSKKVVKNGDSTLLTTTNTFRTVSGNPTGQVATLKNQAAGYNVTYTYTYDSRGNILSVSDGTHTTSYEYDESNQLLRENNQKAGYTHAWVYDSAGNIRYKKIFAYTTAATLGTPTQTITYAHGNSAWVDLLTAVGDRAYTYDQVGNPLSDGKRTYTWQHGRQLATLTQDNKTWSITYDSQGMRASRTAGSTAYKYYYSDGKLISMTCGNDTLYFAYTPDGLPYSVEYNGTQYVYALNLQGDVMAILNTAGTAVVEYTYDAWGNILSCTGSMASSLGQFNPLRYRGYVYDNETQLYYLQSRYYDPEIGRFINADGYTSTGQGFTGNNMFAYCGNNPVLYKDSFGTRHEISAGAVGPYNRSGQNIENMMNVFGVSSADELPSYPDSAMLVMESVSAFPTPLGVSFVCGRSIVMDEDKYCEYTFSGYAYGVGFPVDRYDTVGYVYGVENVADYEGLFLGGSVNLIVDIQGGAIAPNGVRSEIIGGNGFISTTTGVSITNYTALNSGWVYGKANIHWYASPYVTPFNTNGRY